MTLISPAAGLSLETNVLLRLLVNGQFPVDGEKQAFPAGGKGDLCITKISHHPMPPSGIPVLADVNRACQSDLQRFFPTTC